MAPFKRLDPSTVPGIAARLRALRLAMAGDEPGAITEFARQTGLPMASWSLWEGQKPQRIGLDSAIQVAEKWGVTLDWIYRGKWDGLKPEVRHEIRTAARRAVPRLYL